MSTKKRKKEEKPAQKKAPKGGKAARPKAPEERTGAVGAATPEATEEILYTLDRAHEELGAPDGKLERALRSTHPDDELRAEGIKIASERILRAGEALCSKALAHLLSKDSDVQDAARRAGLTRGWLAQTVEALLRLRGENDQAVRLGKATEKKAAGTRSTLAATVARSRRLRRQALARLALAVKASPALAAVFQGARRAPDDVDQLGPQLSSLADLIDSALGDEREEVRTLAELKGLQPSDAAELREAAQALREAREAQGKGTKVRQEELQALIDVLDGFCLLLLEHVIKALRDMADATPKVRRPHLGSLASYFDGNSPAAPAPAPIPAQPAPQK